MASKRGTHTDNCKKVRRSSRLSIKRKHLGGQEASSTKKMRKIQDDSNRSNSDDKNVNLETVRKRGRPLGSRNKKRGRKSLKKTTVKDGCHNDEEVNLSLETGTSGTNNSCLNLSTTNNTSNNDCIFPANTTNNDSINLSATTSNPSNFPTPLTSTNINNTTIPTNTNTNNTQTPTDTNNIPTDTNHTTAPTSTNNNNNDISTNDAIERTYKQFERQIRKGKKYSFLAKEGINDKNRNLKRKENKQTEQNSSPKRKVPKTDNSGISKIENEGGTSKRHSLDSQMDMLHITHGSSSNIPVITSIPELRHRPEVYWVPNEWVESVDVLK